MAQEKLHVWLRGVASAAISGGSGGVVMGFAAMGIAPESFNFDGGMAKTMQLVGFAAVVSAVLGVANYLKQSPLPPEEA